MRPSALCRLSIAALTALHVAFAVAAHPLDPLSSAEIAAAVSVLREAGDIDAETRFALIDLDEPIKQDVLAWQPGQPFVRKAFVVARRDRTVFQGVVDLGARRIESWRSVPHVESAILNEEIENARRITVADSGWRAAMRRRGFDSFEGVFCAPLSAGPTGEPAEAGRRLVRVACFAGPLGEPNIWARPIEGLYAVVDLDENKVIRLIDNGSPPVASKPPQAGETSQPQPQSVSPPAPSRTPQRADFAVSGNEVRWKNWSFHFRMDRRAGLILSLVRYAEAGRERSVLYRGSLAEMFVPYMDPDPGWSFRTYMDEGELGLGLLSSPLAPGIDCPADAAFFEAVLPDGRGRPVLGKSVICLFEHTTDAPLWRHYEAVNGVYRGRPAAELVMRTIPSIGNYDYIIDWVLTEAGVIRIDVGATGIDQVKGVRGASMRDLSATADTAYGGLVAPNLVGANHDHFLSFRLDLDIDGTANTLMRDRLVRRTIADRSGRHSVWQIVEEPIVAEGPLAAGAHGGSEIWRIVNPNITNALGQHPGYELRPEHSAISLLAPDDIAQRRAGFSAASLWVTAYDPSELYAAGPFPNQSAGGDGLPAYAARRRPIENADIVLWCTIGFHHVPGPEDWPVMATMWHSLSLAPAGFFDHNPAIDMPAAISLSGAKPGK
ncbi:MAG: tyramine oxidase [Alphaproteobacteria bacterium]|nr:tyramine oxidase [Alphaproteobacteria bacterium]